jgi:hypothetical protein
MHPVSVHHNPKPIQAKRLFKSDSVNTIKSQKIVLVPPDLLRNVFLLCQRMGHISG